MRKFELGKINEKPGGLFSWFSSAEAKSPTKEYGFLLPANVFQAHLHQERARADRSGSSFVVMTFGIEMSGKYDALEQQAREILAECVFNVFRLCDTKGWYEKKSEPVAVILPDTTANETAAPLARTEDMFARLAKQRLRNHGDTARGPRLVCCIYNYPPPSNSEAPSRDYDNVNIRFRLNTIECDETEKTAMAAGEIANGDQRG